MIALGDWLIENIGPVWMRVMGNPMLPEGTPLSTGRLWVIDVDYDKCRKTKDYKNKSYYIEVDMRRIKSTVRADLLLKWS